jgi:ATP-binding cassette subfamily F protein 3
MALITANDLHKSYATQVVLDGASFEINEGEKIGLIGPNGAGKTTIFRILIGQEEPEIGSVTMSRNLRFGYLAQIQKFDPSNTLRQEVETAFDDVRRLEAEIEAVGHRLGTPEPGDDMDDLLAKLGRLQEQHEAAGGYEYAHRVDAVMHGLGFSDEDGDKPVSVLSGGQKSRAALARLLLKPCDVLLLDEPTNHLDIDAVTWLEQWLSDFKGAVLVISHDRSLLDRVTTKTLELEKKRIVSWPGNYSTYVALKEAKFEAEAKLFEKQQAFIAKTEEFIRRFQAGQRSKQARGRKKRLDRAKEGGDFLEKPGETRKTVRLKLESVERSGQDIVLAENIAMAYSDKAPLFRGLSFRIDRGERVAIVGPNGVGKSTLLKCIVGREKVIAGEIKLGRNVTVGYYDQQHGDLDRSNIVLNELWKVRPKAPEGEVRSMLGRFLFSGDDVTKPIAKLSGGEQSRIVLAKLIWAGHNFLILDEPTNHLDIPSCEVLEGALEDYDGTLLMVSHDRYFLDRLVDRLLVLSPDQNHEDFNGGWSEYADKQAARAAEQKAAKEARAAEEAARAKKQREKEKQAEKKGKGSGGGKSGGSPAAGGERFAKMSLEKLEAEIMAREEKLAGIEVQYGDPAVYGDPARLAGLKAEYENVRGELTALNEAWERKAAEA